MMLKQKWQENTRQRRWLLCFLAAFCICLSIRTLLFPNIETYNSLAITTFLIFIAVVFSTYKMRILAIFALGTAAGFIYFTLFNTIYFQPLITKFSGNHTVSIEITSYSMGGSDYGKARGRIIKIDGESVNGQSALIYFSDSSPDFVPGQKLSFDAELSKSQNPADGIFINLSQRGNIIDISDGKTSIKSQLSIAAKKISEAIDSMASGDTAQLLKALLYGDKSEFTKDFTNALRRSGTSHITAISGMHISIIMAFIMLLFGKRVGVYVALPIILMFALMTGFSYSVIRAVIMAMLTVLAFIFKRENDTLTALFLALGILLCVNPFSIGSISLLLSFASVLGIVVFSPMLTAVFTAKLPKNKYAARFFRNIISCAAVSIAAIVFTMPISMLFFNTVSMVSILSSILILWIISTIMCVGIIGVGTYFVFPFLGKIIFDIMIIPITDAVVFTIRAIAGMPYSAISSHAIYFVAFSAMTVTIFLWFLRKKKADQWILLGLAAAFLLCGGAYMFENGEVEQIAIVNTDGSAAVLIRNNGKPHIINCGAASGGRNLRRIEDKLFDWGCTDANALVLTSLNGTNAGGVDYIMSGGIAKELYAPKSVENISQMEYYTYNKNGQIELENSLIKLYKVSDGTFLSLIDTEKIKVLNTCGTQPLEAMVAIWENKLLADIVILDEKMMNTPYAMEKIFAISAPKMIVCANGGYAYTSGVSGIFSGIVEDLGQVDEIEIKYWAR